MATAKTARELAEERAARAGKKVDSFSKAGKAAIRNIDLQVIDEGMEVVIPSNYKVFEQEIRGNKAVFVVTEEGYSFYPSVLTRGARPADGSPYVKPSGTVVDKCQEYADMDDFFKKELAGKKIKFTKKTPVEAPAFGDAEGTVKINVWTIDFVA